MYIEIRVYRNGIQVGTTTEPYSLEGWANTYGYQLSELTLDLVDTKKWKIEQLRDKANEWYQYNIRAFDGQVVAMKLASGTTLNPEEQGYRTEMMEKYQTKQTLVAQAKNATTVDGVLSVAWPPDLTPIPNRLAGT